MRYLIYGAGAVGATFGACLFESGREVAFIARGEHGRALAANGLRFGTPSGWRTLPIPVVDHPARLTFRSDDIVVLAVKGTDTQAALDALAAVARAGTPIVCAQNGVENERRALRKFAHVHGMWTMLVAVHTEPGVVHAHNTPFSGICDVGRYPRGIDAVDETVAADFEAASLRCSPRADIMSRKYAKLLFNLMNVLEAAGGRGAAPGLVERARAEAIACFEVAGIVPFAGSDERIAAMGMAAVEGVERGGGSTWQSLARGTPALEADDLNGEIVLLGRLHGVATPVNAFLQSLALRLVRDRVAPGSIASEALEDEFGAWIAAGAR